MRLIATLAALALPAAANAQALSCALPGTIPRPQPALASDREPQRLLPIGGYTLAVSWSPEYCQGRIAGREAPAPGGDLECGGRNRFGFTLHGLWPDGIGHDWPQYCKATPLLSPATIRAHLCQTPSPQLMQHEWAKHGTCMAGYTPERYFAQGGDLYRRLHYPDMDRLSRDRGTTVGALQVAMAAANPGLPASAIRVTVNKKGWLNELWLCLDRRFAYERCRADSGGAPANAALKIWRGPRPGSSQSQDDADRDAAG